MRIFTSALFFLVVVLSMHSLSSMQSEDDCLKEYLLSKSLGEHNRSLKEKKDGGSPKAIASSPKNQGSPRKDNRCIVRSAKNSFLAALLASEDILPGNPVPGKPVSGNPGPGNSESSFPGQS